MSGNPEKDSLGSLHCVVSSLFNMNEGFRAPWLHCGLGARWSGLLRLGECRARSHGRLHIQCRQSCQDALQLLYLRRCLQSNHKAKTQQSTPVTVVLVAKTDTQCRARPKTRPRIVRGSPQPCGQVPCTTHNDECELRRCQS